MLIQLHTFLVILHLLAISIGLGTALLADWIVLNRLVFRVVSPRSVEQLIDLSRVVTCGLFFLWLTGSILVVFQLRTAPVQLFHNQKLLAKVFIVVVLTINAAFLHRIALPRVKTRIGYFLFTGPLVERLLPTLLAAVSLASWLFALILGEARELNGTATVEQIFAIYGPCVLFLWIGGLTVTAATRGAGADRGGPAPSWSPEGRVTDAETGGSL